MKCFYFTVLILLVAPFLLAAKSPEQIVLSYSASPLEMVVTWALPDGTTSDGGICEYGISTSSLTSKVVATSQKYTLGSYTSPMLYKATMTGLRDGNQIYYYRVGTESGNFSATYAFKSHPGIGAATGAVNFHLCGDLGQTSNTASTLSEIRENEADLTGALSGGIVSMGDLSYANGNEPLWDSFGNLLDYTSETIPMMTTLGNHEWFDDPQYNFTAYLARFTNPPVEGKRELYYSYDSGLVHWVMVAGYCKEMNSTATQPCLAPDSAQSKWLEADLNAVDRSVTPWVFVVFHQPYMNSNTAHSYSTEGVPMQNAIEDTLYDYGVDLVFSGHVHAYERSCQVYKLTCTPGAPYYITIGDGGNAEGLASTWVNPQPAWSLYRQASYGHGEVLVYNSTHARWQWHQNQDLSPIVADEFWLVKGQSITNENRVTREPVFAVNSRGVRAAKFDRMIKERGY